MERVFCGVGQMSTPDLEPLDDIREIVSTAMGYAPDYKGPYGYESTAAYDNRHITQSSIGRAVIAYLNARPETEEKKDGL